MISYEQRMSAGGYRITLPIHSLCRNSWNNDTHIAWIEYIMWITEFRNFLMIQSS